MEIVHILAVLITVAHLIFYITAFPLVITGIRSLRPILDFFAWLQMMNAYLSKMTF